MRGGLPPGTFFNLGTDLAQWYAVYPTIRDGNRASVRREEGRLRRPGPALLEAPSRTSSAGEVEGNLQLTDGQRRESSHEAEMTALFLRALFRLGVFAGDWDAWYGTRQPLYPQPGRRAEALGHPSNPTSTRQPSGYRGE